MGKNQLPVSLDLSFTPIWNYISCVRSFVSNFFSISLQNKSEADKISLAVSELLENAVKYSSAPGVRVSINITTGKDDKEIIVLVQNKTTQANIDSLQKEIEKINNSDPEKIYLEKMQEAMSRPPTQAGLGLIQIRIVSKTDLELYMKSNDEVQVKVSFVIPELGDPL